MSVFELYCWGYNWGCIVNKLIVILKGIPFDPVVAMIKISGWNGVSPLTMKIPNPFSSMVSLDVRYLQQKPLKRWYHRGYPVPASKQGLATLPIFPWFSVKIWAKPGNLGKLSSTGPDEPSQHDGKSSRSGALYHETIPV